MNQQNLKVKKDIEKTCWPNTQCMQLNNHVTYLFTKTKIKIYKNLPNITPKLIPIDILFHTKRYQLFQVIIDELETIIIDTITVQITPTKLQQNKNLILHDLLKKSEENFFQKCNLLHLLDSSCGYPLLNYDNKMTDHIENLLEIVLGFCLFGSSNKIKSIFHPDFSEKISVLQVEVLFENFMIETSNYCIDALLRSSSGIIFGFQNYIFDEKYYSIRKVEEFRNNLMWYKFTNRYIDIPKNIYENRFTIWIIGPKGIISKKIFGHRLYELPSLSTTQLIITFILEIQDFFLPKFYNLIQILAKAIFYIISGPIKSKIYLVWKNISNDVS